MKKARSVADAREKQYKILDSIVCKACGKEEIKEVKEGEEVKSCCGQSMEKKET